MYGKLPFKRDFIAISVPRDLLNVWEPWLQGGIAASRMKLGAAWQTEFLRAPLWRFWLGGGVAGRATLGALMPSVDGVGRYFPLVVFTQSDPGEELAPPEFDGYEGWFGAAEDLLLSALAEDGSFEAVTAGLAKLPPAVSGATARLRRPDLFTASDGTVVASLEKRDLASELAAIRAHDHARAYAHQTFWWTAGGEGFLPQLMVGARMPDPYLFTGLLTGRFAEAL